MFQTILTQPLYNGFIFLIGIMPGGDVGLAILALTLVIRAVFYPAFAAQIRTTMGMQAIQGEIDDINKKYKDNPEEKGKQTMELFKRNKVSPFGSIVPLLIQIPIFIALYFTFFHTALPTINTALLYSFVKVPSVITIHFLGLLDLTSKSNVVMTLIVGILQFLVMHFSLGRVAKSAKNLSEEKLAAQKMQQRMMLYVLPAVIAAVSYSLPAAVGLYFAAGSLISLGQEWLIRRELVKHPIK